MKKWKHADFLRKDKYKFNFCLLLITKQLKNKLKRQVEAHFANLAYCSVFFQFTHFIFHFSQNFFSREVNANK